MSLDWKKITESKKAYRKKLAARPIAEKLRMLDALRARALSIRAAKSGQTAVIREQPSDYEKK